MDSFDAELIYGNGKDKKPVPGDGPVLACHGMDGKIFAYRKYKAQRIWFVARDSGWEVVSEFELHKIYKQIGFAHIDLEV